MRRLFRKLIVLLILVTMVAPTAIRVLVFAADGRHLAIKRDSTGYVFARTFKGGQL